jgi:hypothetical protein
MVLQLRAGVKPNSLATVCVTMARDSIAAALMGAGCLEASFTLQLEEQLDHPKRRTFKLESTTLIGLRTTDYTTWWLLHHNITLYKTYF